MITLIENDISLEEYLTLREKVGWKKLTDKQAAHALANCLYKVKAVDADGQVVGMGRVVGDGAVVCYIQDLIVIPQVQAQGIGSGISTKTSWIQGAKYTDSICRKYPGGGYTDDAMSDVCQGQRAIL